MSGLCLYELGGVAWDEAGETGDHIVPHTCTEHWKRHTPLVPMAQTSGIWSVQCSCDEEPPFANLKKRKANMLENSSWIQSCNDVFASPCGGDKKRESIRSECDGSKMPACFRSLASKSTDTGFPCENSILDGSCTTSGNGIYDFPLASLSNSERNINFFGNDHDESENNGGLYYGWTDIESFDDVDAMFRGCDSTFGVDNMSTGELCWFPPSNIVEENKDVVKNGVKTDQSPCTGCFDCKETYRLGNKGLSNEDNNGLSVSPVSFLTSSSTSDGNELGVPHSFPFAKGSARAEIKNGVIYKDQGNDPPLTSNVQESSPLNKTDDVTIEATRFQQLQHVINQLDLNTKLTVRDSLCRLARSSEQRCGSDKDGVAFSEGNKFEFREMEIHTNPIDRSVAHLLFHRPPPSPGSNA